ncbi:MAG TPA: NifB/NifX family molybdenum-iron cluster-binding protein [Balneolales bacterium]|nr:NifB/NifX family molybdenum-iron cluster-binding protein [Balneolales bacterium]
MKIAVSSHNRKKITGHTGRCRRFYIYEISDDNVINKDLLEITKEQTFHESHGQTNHPLSNVEVLITGGMGMGLFRRLTAQNIEPIITTEEDPDRAVSLYLAGELTSETPVEGSCHH